MSQSQEDDTTATGEPTGAPAQVLALLKALIECGVTPRSIRIGEVEVQVASVMKPSSDEAVTAAHPSGPSGYLSRALDRRERSMR